MLRWFALGVGDVGVVAVPCDVVGDVRIGVRVARIHATVFVFVVVVLPILVHVGVCGSGGCVSIRQCWWYLSWWVAVFEDAD